jgi:hypothetical protein
MPSIHRMPNIHTNGRRICCGNSTFWLCWSLIRPRRVDHLCPFLAAGRCTDEADILIGAVTHICFAPATIGNLICRCSGRPSRYRTALHGHVSCNARAATRANGSLSSNGSHGKKTEPTVKTSVAESGPDIPRRKSRNGGAEPSVSAVGKLDFEVPRGRREPTAAGSRPSAQVHEKKTAQRAAFCAKGQRAGYLDSQSLSSLSSSTDNACPSLD